MSVCGTDRRRPRSTTWLRALLTLASYTGEFGQAWHIWQNNLPHWCGSTGPGIYHPESHASAPIYPTSSWNTKPPSGGNLFSTLSRLHRCAYTNFNRAKTQMPHGTGLNGRLRRLIYLFFPYCIISKCIYTGCRRSEGRLLLDFTRLAGGLALAGEGLDFIYCFFQIVIALYFLLTIHIKCGRWTSSCVIWGLDSEDGPVFAFLYIMGGWPPDKD